MRISILVSLTLLVLLTAVKSYTEEEGSLILTELDFHKALSENDYLLVNFHALWCRYSKKLKPEWNKLAQSLKDIKPKVQLAKVEAYDEKKLAQEYEIEGYPTIKLFIHGQPHDYNGERIESHILEFAKRKLKKELRTVSSVDAIKNLLKEYEWVGLYSGSDENELSSIKDIAFEQGDILFVQVSDSSIIQNYGIKEHKFALVNNITNDHYAHKGAITTNDLKKFIQDHRFPGVPKFSKGTAERIFLSEDPSMILIVKNDDKGKSAENAFKEAHDTLKDKIFMSVANYNDEIGKLLAENLGVQSSEIPAVRIVRADKEKIRKWRLKKDISKDSITEFYQDYKNKVAERTYLSEPKPKENNDLVWKVVGNTFREIVEDANKDVLVLFWAPWCGHCRAMMPVYDNVARKTKPVTDFLVAKIDLSVNEVDGFGIDIVEYPTILLFTRKDKKNPIEFKGERNEFAFNDFIRSHATVNLDKMKGPNPFDKNEL